LLEKTTFKCYFGVFSCLWRCREALYRDSWCALHYPAQMRLDQ